MSNVFHLVTDEGYKPLRHLWQTEGRGLTVSEDLSTSQHTHVLMFLLIMWDRKHTPRCCQASVMDVPLGGPILPLNFTILGHLMRLMARTLRKFDLLTILLPTQMHPVLTAQHQAADRHGYR